MSHGKGRARGCTTGSRVWLGVSEEHGDPESTETRRFKERPGHRAGLTNSRHRGSAVPGWLLAEN